MIYCSNCGKGIPDASKFCTFCGNAIKGADPQIHNDATSSTPVINLQSEHHVPKPPIAQTHVTTPPTHQQYIPPTTPQPHQQYVPPTPPPAHQYVNPAYTAPHLQQTLQSNQNVSVAKNEFYKNAGFWGAVLMLIGFFLPYVSAVDASFYYLVSDLAPDKPELYMYLIFPVCAAIIILQALTGALPKFLIAIFKILPFLLLILFAQLVIAFRPKILRLILLNFLYLHRFRFFHLFCCISMHFNQSYYLN